jgi:Uncharacterised nucleotidyltransferase/Bacterial lectin
MKPAFMSARSFGRIGLCVLTLCLGGLGAVRAAAPSAAAFVSPLPVIESFSGEMTANSWTALGTAHLTGSALELTPATGGNGAFILDDLIPAYGIDAEFDWETNGSADGMTFFMVDESAGTPTLGGGGGGFGYVGMANAHVAVAFDEYNQRIIVIGGASSGFAVLASAPFDPRGAHRGRVRFANQAIRVDVQNVGGDWSTVFPKVVIDGFPRSVKVGFSAATGEVVAQHLVRNVVINDIPLTIKTMASKDLTTGLITMRSYVQNWSPTTTFSGVTLTASGFNATVPSLPDVRPSDGAAIVAARLAQVVLACPAVVADAAIAATLRTAAIREAALSSAIVRSAEAVQIELSRRSIRSVVIKGVAASAFLPIARRFGDVDILVDPADFTASIAALSSAGFTTDHIFGQSPRRLAMLVPSLNMARAAHEQADIHQVIGPWNLGCRLRFADVVDRAERCTVGGVELTIAAPEDTLFHTALSMLGDTGSGYAKPWPWFDLVALARRSDATRLASVNEASGLGWVVRRMFDELPDSLVPVTAVAAVRGDRSALDSLRCRALTSAVRQKRNDVDHAIRLGFGRGAARLTIDVGRALRDRVHRRSPAYASPLL